MNRFHAHAPSTAPRPDGSARDLVLPSVAPGHGVQFYEDEDYLAAAVSDFLAAGLTLGQPSVVIATEPHRNAFLRRLSNEGFDVDDASRSGHLTLLDARETLSAFMVDDKPSGDRFRKTVGPVVDRGTRRTNGGVLRLYGEMVDLLWKDGNTEGAIELEELWNELGNDYAFSLLCAYAMDNFYKSADAERFHAICRQHTHVIPTERYTRADKEGRLIEISLLQQRARALEAEIEHRKELEQRLRASLAARRSAEESLRETTRELKAWLDERESLLAREQAARAEAERADRAKSQFLAMMSHELRTPLNAIGGHVQLIEMGVHGPVTEAQREALRRVERSQRHLLSLINDILNLTRIAAGRVDFTIDRIELVPLLEEIVSMLEPLLAERGLTCEMDPSPDRGLAVQADREKIHQVVVNLFTNAIKFTPRGGRVCVSAAPCQHTPTMISVQVSDTGVGIPAAELERIFQPFVQLGKRPTKEQDGVGLGLAISRDLALGMGGDLTATSEVGIGSTFTLLLPRV